MSSADDGTKSEEEIRAAAVRKAMKLISLRDHTEKEMTDKLKAGGFPPFAIDEAIEYLKSYRYLDDARYAELYVSFRRSEKSLFEIRENLKMKGVASEWIDEAIEKAEVCESETVKKTFLKKYGSKDLSDEKLYEKALRYFASRGFPYGAAKEGIALAIQEIEAENR